MRQIRTCEKSGHAKNPHMRKIGTCDKSGHAKNPHATKIRIPRFSAYHDFLHATILCTCQRELNLNLILTGPNLQSIDWNINEVNALLISLAISSLLVSRRLQHVLLKRTSAVTTLVVDNDQLDLICY